jgi:RNA polymerase sigma-70 factor (ECF subfamily)
MDAEVENRFVEQLVACQGKLYRFIATLVINHADAEELFQEASMTAWRTRDKFDFQREFFPWICGIARNQVRHYYRDGKRPLPLQLADDVVDQLAEEQIRNADLLERQQETLTKCLEKLPLRQRDYLRQFYRKSQTVAAFSQEQGSSAAAAYKMLQRIRNALLDCIHRSLAGETC